MDTNNTAAPAQVTITLHYPLAGAYTAKSYTKAIRSHASIDGSTPLCGNLKHELCDLQEGPDAQAKLCGRCASKLAKLLAQGAVLKLGK